MNIEKSADEMDMASELEMMFNESAIAAVCCKLDPQHEEGFDGLNCVECEDPLPEIRLTMKRIRCVACQSVVESRGKFFGS